MSGPPDNGSGPIVRTSRILHLALLFGLVLRFGPSYSLDVDISLYNDHLVQSVVFTAVEGYYRISGDGTETVSAGPGSSWFFMYRNDSLYIRDQHGNWFGGSEILIEAEGDAAFLIKSTDPILEAREYHGSLLVGISTGGLSMINRINLETYVMGVTESEAGPRSTLEYYKVQAILCRTYALKNLGRHEEEGFHLCDGVHCQAYHGRHVWNEDVEIGTEVTSGLVICDQDTVMINPVYHSNSGGETRGAEDAWLVGESYLKPVLDPFSLGRKNSAWQRNMHLDDWLAYLLSYGISFPEMGDTAQLELRLPHRQKYYRAFGDSIAVRDIRDDFRYRSDWFDVIVDGRMIRILGKGYGHGVGLSQEGAMEMARRRYHYTAILNYYYHGILIIPYLFLETADPAEGNLQLFP